ncbi:MAG: hypothetical protein BWK80_37135 [Desulfobacteraceae bacterium IS3]|nr:MAG: hypothetical protein BWK80_37135 [Desulfobacteraceae bacterium IS3]
MPRIIKLIVTGDMEKSALHESLRRFFPDELNGEEVKWDKPRKLHCATSSQLRPLEKNNSNLSTPMKHLAQAMFDEILYGKTGKPADLVIVIDDAEIGNLGQENIVADHFRAAIEHLFKKKQYNREDRYRDILREKCSFHLLKPMTESYFFGDADALRNAGVQDAVKPKLVYSDVEQFESNDPAWLPICQKENKKRQQVMSWWYHECHPKHYLEHLTERSGVFYDENTYGKKALEEIAWRQVPKCQSDTVFIRSLFEDIAEWFGILNPLGSGDTSLNFYPDRRINRDLMLLRNI